MQNSPLLHFVVLLHFVKNLLLHSQNLRINQGAIRHNRSLVLN